MRRLTRYLALFLALFAAGIGSGAQAADKLPRIVEVGENIDWSFERDGPSERYLVSDITLEMEGRRDPEVPDLIQPLLTVEMPGFAPVTLPGAPTGASFDHRVTVGRWAGERLFVLFQSFSGGAHCCNQIQLVLPEKESLRIIDLGEWDGGYRDELPTDLDGDGVVDFVFVDNAFLYAFASYAESDAPPLIMNVVDGQAVDVSTRPGFRPLFERKRAESRERCVRPQDISPNGACAAFVAAAARIGRFDEAWADMLRSYDRASDWDLPTGCRSTTVEQPCPEGSVIRFETYPDALRHFLAAQGYIPR